jgi:hypothetical protein
MDSRNQSSDPDILSEFTSSGSSSQERVVHRLFRKSRSKLLSMFRRRSSGGMVLSRPLPLGFLRLVLTLDENALSRPF